MSCLKSKLPSPEILTVISFVLPFDTWRLLQTSMIAVSVCSFRGSSTWLVRENKDFYVRIYTALTTQLTTLSLKADTGEIYSVTAPHLGGVCVASWRCCSQVLLHDPRSGSSWQRVRMGVRTWLAWSQHVKGCLACECMSVYRFWAGPVTEQIFWFFATCRIFCDHLTCCDEVNTVLSHQDTHETKFAWIRFVLLNLLNQIVIFLWFWNVR